MHISNAYQNCTHHWISNLTAMVVIPAVILAFGFSVALIMQVYYTQELRRIIHEGHRQTGAGSYSGTYREV